MPTVFAILTEWPEFRLPNFRIVKRLVNRPVVFDGRNIYDKQQMLQEGSTISVSVYVRNARWNPAHGRQRLPDQQDSISVLY